jgi:hypothetical protein
MGAEMQITVSQPRAIGTKGHRRYDVVRGDGRIVAVDVLADEGGKARVGIPQRGVGFVFGDAVSFDAAIAVAKAYLRGME